MTRTRFVALGLGVALLATSCGRGIDEAAAGVTTLAPTTTTTTTAPVTGDTEPPPEAGEITVWVPLRQRAVVGEAAAAFTTATGIDVTIETVELGEMEAAISGAVGPDIFLGKHTWLARLAPRGLAAPLGLEPRMSEFVSVAAEAFTYGDAVYGAPVTMESIALFHNLAVVPTAPGAVSEIKETCAQLRGDVTTTTAGTTTTAPVPVGAGCLEYATQDARITTAFITAGDGYLYLEAEGGYLIGDVGLTTPSAASRAATLRDLAVEGVLKGAPDMATMVGRFAAGETPFLIGGIELAESLSGSGTPFGVAPLPIITGATPQPFVDVTGWMLAGRSNEADTASLFLNDYLITGVTMAELFASSSQLPAYAATVDLVGADPVIAGLLEAAFKGTPTPVVDGIDALLEELGPVLASIIDPRGPEIEVVLAQAADLALTLAVA